MEGWIKLHRSILQWDWYSDNNTKVVFIHLLLNANTQDIKWRGITILRGQRFTSVANLSRELHLTSKQIRIALTKLEKTKELAINGANNGTMITICKYDYYQSSKKQKGKQEGKQGANKGQQIKKEENKENDIETRKKEFSETLKPFVGKYSKDMLNNFYFYWSEETQDKTKLRFELQDTWSVAGRLRTWFNHEYKFKKVEDKY